MSWLYLLDRVRLLTTHCTRCLRVPPAPGLPCALCSERERRICKPRTNRVARMRTAVSTSLRAKRSNPALPRKKLDCFVACAPRNDAEGWRPRPQPPMLFAIPAFPGAAKPIMVPASLRQIEAAYQTRSKAYGGTWAFGG